MRLQNLLARNSGKLSGPIINLTPGGSLDMSKRKYYTWNKNKTKKNRVEIKNNIAE